MEVPLKKWGEASAAYRGARTPTSLARLLLASRNLSNNLVDAGIQVTPDALASVGGDSKPQESMPPGVYPMQ
jgi:hypothetical protein